MVCNTPSQSFPIADSKEYAATCNPKVANPKGCVRHSSSVIEPLIVVTLSASVVAHHPLQMEIVSMPSANRGFIVRWSTV